MKKIISVLLSILMIMSLCVVGITAETVPQLSDEDLENMFTQVGFATWAGNYFGVSVTGVEVAPPETVFYYMQNFGRLSDYCDDEGYITINYDEYMGLVIKNFVNYPEMKAYFETHFEDAYDEETNTLRWFAGGFGDAVTWEVRDIYRDGETVYVTGVFAAFYYEDEEYDAMEPYWECIEMEDGSRAKLLETIVMTLNYVDGNWKILEYRNGIGYYIYEDTLYDTFEKQLYCKFTVDAPHATVEISDNSSDFTSGFYANGDRWYLPGSMFTLNITPEEGYSIVSVTATDDVGTYDVMYTPNGYELPPKGTAVLNVETVANFIEVVENTETVVSKADTKEVFAVANVTVEELVENLNNDVTVLDKNGEVVSQNDAPLASGMQLILKDDNGNVLDEVTVVVPGDVNGDAKVLAADARTALRAAVKLESDMESWATAAANVDGEAEIRAADARLILRAAVQLEDMTDWLVSVQ